MLGSLNLLKLFGTSLMRIVWEEAPWLSSDALGDSRPQ